MFVFIAAATVCVLSFAPPAFAIFEKYNLYGLGANAFSLGAPAIPSRFDTLAYLSNPAFMTEIYGDYYVLSSATLNSSMNPELDYKYTLFGYTKAQKRALTLAITSDGGMQRKLLTYTFGSKSNSMSYGLNISGYQYEFLDAQRQPAGDGSGFAMDLGVLLSEGDRLRYGMSIKNFISSTSSTEDTSHGSISRKLSQVMSLGMSYKLNRNMDMNLSYHRFRGDPTETSSEERNATAVVLGFEYSLPPGASVRVSGAKEKETLLPELSSRMALAGASYRTGNYDISFAMIGRGGMYNSSQALTLTYKTGGTWDAPPPSLPAAEPLPDAATIEAQTFEDPLPALTLAQAPTDLLAPNPAAPAYAQNAEPTASDAGALEIKNVRVSPLALLIPSYGKPAYTDTAGQWYAPFVTALAAEGFFANDNADTFRAAEFISREEFYRLVFLMQLSRMFREPVTILFSTEQPVNAEVTLGAPHLGSPVKLVSGKYETAGDKRLVLDRQLFLDKQVFPGRYKMRVALTSDDEQGDIEEYITVLDSSIDFTGIKGLSGDLRGQRVDELIQRLGNLGLNITYLKDLGREGQVTRVEALQAALTALGASPPAGAGREAVFPDTLGLTDAERDAVFLGSRALRSLNGMPLMGGYADGTFRPDMAITRAEATALIFRALQANSADFKPPYAAPFMLANTPEHETAPTVDAPPAPVAVEAPPEYIYMVVAASYLVEANAQKTMNKLAKKGVAATIVAETVGTGPAYHVVIGTYTRESDAHAAMAAFKMKGYTPKVKAVAINASAPAPSPSPAKAKPKTSGKD